MSSEPGLSILLFIVSIVVVIIDQLVKLLILSSMTLGLSIPVCPGVFHITYIQNPGAAFGILVEQRWIFIVASVILLVVAVCFYQRLQKESPAIKYGTALLLGGAMGNLIDRIWRGQVIDFLDFRVWPVFNIADIAIVIGVGGIMYALLQQDGKEADR